MAGGNARTAIHHHLLRLGPGENAEKLLAQFRRRPERSGSVEVVAEATVARSGDMPAHRVHGLVFAAETVRTAGVDQADVVLPEICQNLVRRDHPVAQADFELRSNGTTHLVTAAALFDLTSRRWLERFVAGLTSLRLPLYTVLTYDGRETWQPPHPADARMLAAFKHHQHGDKGFGPAAGPEATDVLAEAFRKSGFAVSIGDSAWRIDETRHELAQVLAKGIADAVLETGHVDPTTVADWLASKAQKPSALVGHHDLWARPV